MSRFLQNLWEKSRHSFSDLSLLDVCVFVFLWVLEKVYRLCFFIISCKKRFFGGSSIGGVKILSVGNLSVGGTGKSVFVKFLIEVLGQDKAGVVLRGYKRACGTQDSFIVCDGERLFCDWSFCGDEAYMIAREGLVPVAVGANRVSACRALRSTGGSGEAGNIKFVVLDDAYQNHQLKKNFEILILDARKPFENGYCLPAGRLREKDFSRADVIVLSHSDKVSSDALIDIKNRQLSLFDVERIFFGKHAFAGVFLFNKGSDLNDVLRKKKVLVFAGIGSFSGFEQSVKKQKFHVCSKLEFDDHHSYTKQDAEKINNMVRKEGLFGAITTSKDWYKIEPFFKMEPKRQRTKIFVFRVSFEFLLGSEYNSFMVLLNRSL
jgi:tetraacyldisaccharide 4'-kinase